MKIWLTSDNVAWDARRYRYPAEQMLLTLFPGERPEYPETPIPTDLFAQPNAAVFTLHRGKKLTNMSALVLRDGQWRNGVARFPSDRLDEPEEQVYHTVSHALKQAFYKAGCALLGRELPWGSLTGVRPVKLPTRAMLAGKTARQAEQELRQVYRVSPPRAALAVECAQAALDVDRQLGDGGMALYLGIPFCPTRCAYCSFISADVKRSLSLVEPYVDGLCREIELAGRLLRERGVHISCAYMGGGTPTTLSAEQLHKILSAVENFLPMERCAEFTVEAGRPDTITADKLETLKRHGIHRISINPQSMEDQVLRAMGRSHTAGEIVEAMALAGEHFGGLVNMDLIAGLPADTLAGFGRTLEKVLDMEPANITVHTLALKKGSRLTEEGGELCGPEAVENMLETASARLRGAGYAPYYLYRQKYMSGSFENVGWARPGAVCAYNIVMMEELQSVLSLGAGGITKLVDPENRKIIRLSNPKYAKEYLEGWEKIAAGKERAARFQGELASRAGPAGDGSRQKS
ncbi:MAG: coproporphyrinogen dehydrogenase HemZ [Oscillospiraceae bacterium]|jgi:oxygen-independent coproporphyrinogen-3 oxidase|nr:coproporphyrinogen dehydrogenase HemZ [Oscillospiraceae bacterium]